MVVGADGCGHLIWRKDKVFMKHVGKEMEEDYQATLEHDVEEQEVLDMRKMGVSKEEDWKKLRG